MSNEQPNVSNGGAIHAELKKHSERIPLAPDARLCVAISDLQIAHFDYTLCDGGISSSKSSWRSHVKGERARGNEIRVGNCVLWRNKTDVKNYMVLARELGVDEVRFSLDLTRVVASGGQVIPEGLEYLREILDAAQEEKVGMTIGFYHRAMPEDMLWTDGKTPEYFASGSEIVIDNFKTHTALSGFIIAVELLNELLAGSISGNFPPYKRVFDTDAKLAYKKMAEYYKLVVDMIYKKYDNNPPQVSLVHNWIPMKPKHDIAFAVNRKAVDFFYRNWNENLEGFLDPRVILAISAYANIENFSVLDKHTIPFINDTLMYNGNPNAARVALEEMHAYLVRTGHNDVKIALGEMGIGKPPYIDAVKANWAGAHAEYLKRAFSELTRLSFPIHGLGVWTLHGTEWQHGDTFPYGLVTVDKDSPNGFARTPAFEVVRKVFKNRGRIS